MWPGDVFVACADITTLQEDFDFKAKTKLRTGLRKFEE